MATKISIFIKKHAKKRSILPLQSKISCIFAAQSEKHLIIHLNKVLAAASAPPSPADGLYGGAGEKPEATKTMYWTLELATYLEDAPWPATKAELLDYAQRSGCPLEVIENLEELEEESEIYETIEDVWPDYPSKEDFLWNEDEY